MPIKTTTEFDEAIMMLFSTHPEAWKRLEEGFKDLALRYTKMSIANTNNERLQQQLLGKVDVCMDLSERRKRLEDAE